MPRSTVCLSFDFDALSVWFEHPHITPAMLVRGEYGARVGVPRMLELLRRHNTARRSLSRAIPSSLLHEETHHPQAGHEVAHHSYAHVDPSQQTRDAELADMERALAGSNAWG